MVQLHLSCDAVRRSALRGNAESEKHFAEISAIEKQRLIRAELHVGETPPRRQVLRGASKMRLLRIRTSPVQDQAVKELVLLDSSQGRAALLGYLARKIQAQPVDRVPTLGKFDDLGHVPLEGERCLLGRGTPAEDFGFDVCRCCERIEVWQRIELLQPYTELDPVRTESHVRSLQLLVGEAAFVTTFA
jgi:hypothetical protein